VIRLIVFPNFDDRYFVWAYLFSAIALIHTSHARSSGKEESTRGHDL
jgi:hypothetical protein